MLPDREDRITLAAEEAAVPSVPRPVSLNLVSPEFGVGLGPPVVDRAAMPEAAVNENEQVERWNEEVGPSGQAFGLVDYPSAGRGPEGLKEKQFRFGIPATDSGHYPRPDLRRDGIHSPQSAVLLGTFPG